MTSPEDVTKLLVDWGNGDGAALEKLMPLVYDELRRLAARYLQKERPDHTIQATALVHEAYMRLVDQREVRWQNRSHFFAIAAQMMRRVLVNYAVAQQAEKRGGKKIKISLADLADLPDEKNLEIVALNAALDKLAAMDERKSRLVELRFFGGLTMEETAEVMGVSLATAKRDWTMARAWLYREIRKEEPHDA